MPSRINGAAGAFENLSGNIQYYTVYASAPLAYTDPDNTSGLNIRVTGDYSDDSQKNFEVLIQAIGLRAMPVLMNNPVPYASLETMGAPTLTGEGFVWKFAVEREGIFENSGPNGTIGPIGFLIDELNGIILPSGVQIKTKAPGKNMEFSRSELLS